MRACAPTVNQSMSIDYFPAAWAIDVVPERIGENQDHRHHEAVDRDGLDHRQADEQGARYRRRRIGLLRQGRSRPWRPRALRRAPGPMLPSAIVRPAVRIEAIAMIVMLSMVSSLSSRFTLRLVADGLGLPSRAAAAM